MKSATGSDFNAGEFITPLIGGKIEYERRCLGVAMAWDVDRLGGLGDWELIGVTAWLLKALLVLLLLIFYSRYARSGRSRLYTSARALCGHRGWNELPQF